MWTWINSQRALAKRQPFTLACLLVKIDDYAATCQANGNDYGEGLERDLVSVMLAVFRESDILVHYADGQFVALLSHCELAHAEEVAKRLQAAVDAESLADLPPGEVSCTIGVAAWDKADPCEGEALLELAQQLLTSIKVQTVA